MSEFNKNLGFFQGLALYLAAVLGTGILVTPLMAWQEGGPASLVAWLVLGLLGFTLAWTFASVGAEKPDAGGVQAMIGRVFGSQIESMSRYLIFFSVPAGAVAASHILGHHMCSAFSMPLSYLPWFTYGSWILITLINYVGIQVSSNVQLILSSVLVLLLLAFVAIAFPWVTREHFEPFAPRGFSGVGHSAVIVFWSFLGWEAIAHLAEEFKNPKRDMMRAAVVAAVVVGVLYFAVSFVLIGSGYASTVSDMAPLVAVAAQKLGGAGRIFVGVLAAIICFGTMNAYMAGLSRLGYAMARDGDLPKQIAVMGSNGTPRKSILLQLFLNVLALSIQWVFRIDLKLFFLIPNLSFLILYVLGCLAAAKLLKGRSWAVASAYVSAIMCAVMTPFASGVWWVPLLIIAMALAKSRLARH